MQKAITLISGSVLVIVALFFGAVFSGTILWFIYSHIHALFPTAASSGIIPYTLGWWDAVCITWIFGLLVKSSSSSSSSK